MHILIIPGEELNEKNTYSSVFELHQAKALQQAGLQCGFVSIYINGNLIQNIKNLLLFKINAIPLLKTLVKSKKINLLKVHGFNVVECVGYYVWAGKFKTKYQEQARLGLRAYKTYVNQFGKPDLIHAHSRFLTGGLIALAIKKKYNIPFVLTEHSTFYARDLVTKHDLELTKELINNSRTWIAVSPELGKLVTSLLQAKANKNFNYIPNVLDPYFENEEVALLANNNKFVFLNIASLESKKGHDILLKSFALAFGGNLFFQLQIGGSGDLETQLKKQVITLKLENQVTFLGQLNRTEIIETYRKANVFVLPSLYETFGVVLIEALAMGKPIIATKCGGPENIVTEKNGVLVEPNNAEQLSDAMQNIAKVWSNFSPKLLKDTCISKFGSVKFASSMQIVYSQTLGI